MQRRGVCSEIIMVDGMKCVDWWKQLYVNKRRVWRPPVVDLYTSARWD